MRELEDMATGMAIRAIGDANRHGGLLRKANFQLQTNFENACPRASKTWMGRSHKALRVIWPRFRVHTMPDLQLSGVPPREPGVKLSKHFSSSAWHANWEKRQASLFSHPPTFSQQDYLLYVILDDLCERSLEEGIPVQPRPT